MYNIYIASYFATHLLKEIRADKDKIVPSLESYLVRC